MKRSLFTTVLCGALVATSVSLSADTTEAGGPNNNAPRFGQGGRGQFGGGRGQFGGGRGQFGGGRGQFGGGRGQFGGGRGGFGGGMMMAGGGMLGRITKENEIQQKFPKEYAEVVKQLIDAENKLQELAKQAKVELPTDNNHVYRQLKLKAPAEFAAIEKKLASRETMREAFGELRALAEKHNLKLSFGFGMGFRRGGEAPQNASRPQMRQNDAAKVRQIREKFPKEWEQVRNLRREGKQRESDELLKELLRRVDAQRSQAQTPSAK